MLWMTRTPLRVSLFGGGTDYPEYFERKPGAVVGFAINRYIHIAALRLSVYQDYSYRVAYSRLEQVSKVEDIQHPVVREALRDFGVTDHLDISVMSDLPASGSGLGSSSAFTVGFVRLIHALLDKPAAKIEVARRAMRVEHDLLAENVGVQDQLHAAFGGFNRYDFCGSDIGVTPVKASADSLADLQRHLVLVHTGIGRRASDAVNAQVAATRRRELDRDLADLYALVEACVALVEAAPRSFLPELGRMLNESWRIKRGLTARVSNDSVDAVFDAIRRAGAYGAKLCGAGGGGYFVALAPPERHAALAAAVAPLAVLPIAFDTVGSTLVYPPTADGGREPALAALVQSVA